MLPRAEGLSDRQAAEAVRSRMKGKYTVSLEVIDPGFDHFDCYGARIGNDHLPKIDAAPQALAATIGADGRRLLQAVETATDVPWLRCWVRPILRRIGRISHPFVSVSARLWQTLRFGQCCVVPMYTVSSA